MAFPPSDRSFVAQHLTDDPLQLLLKHGKEKQPLIAQIEARQKIRHKLPEWAQNLDLVLPAVVSLEQSSSEATAQYKASLVWGQLLIDLTGGMGVDAFYFAPRFERIIYLEQNPDLVAQARHNFEVLGIKNIDCICADSLHFLAQFSQKADWIYADPARRSAAAGRVHGLQDCQPDVVSHWPLLLQKSNNMLLKTSPLLDIKQAIGTLQKVSEVQVVAVQNEVKEVLFLIKNTENQDIKTHSINLSDAPPYLPIHRFTHLMSEETNLTVPLHNPLRYVYEPNATILKAGAFKSVAAQFDLYKIAPHSHLYTSDVLVQNFPGRIFEWQATTKADAKALAPHLPHGKANLTLRNFPSTTDELRQKLKLKDGGDVYLLATTLSNGNKRILVCKKV